MICRTLATAASPIVLEPVAADQVVSGQPLAGVLELSGFAVPCGLWEHSVGTSTDVEVDEVFVVLTGRATIDVAGSASLDVGPGDVVHLVAGARTTWHVHETLRKFWVTPA